MKVILLFASLIVQPAAGEWCAAKPDPGFENVDGYSWRWRLVDGRKCWFYSRRQLDKSDLVWSYDIDEFDEPQNGGVAGRERRFYTPDELKLNW